MKALDKIKNIRTKNLFRYKKTKTAFAVLFPLVLTLITELVHMNSFPALLRFAADKPKIIIFNFIVILMIYGALTFLFRSLTVSMALCSGTLYAFSLVEYFKFEMNGTHFYISDLLMSAKFGDLQNFVLFRPTVGIIAGFLILAAYVLIVFLLNIKFKPKRIFSYASSFCIIAVFIGVVAVKPVYSFVYSAFEINTNDDNNIILSHEKFIENKLIANLTESISKEFDRLLNTPESYSPEMIDSYLGGFSNVQNKEVKDGVTPNIVMVMSESFADMRLIEGISVPAGVYDGYDFIAGSRNSRSGMAIVPTFGGGTVKTEFELIFGLPMKSVKNTALPQNLFKINGETEESFAKFYQESGYATAYIHPYKASFYNRERIYAEFGFDELIFDDDLTVTPEYFYDFIDDETVYKQIADILEKNEKPSYIFATTMQNHMPYIDESFNGTELEFYFAGIKRTTSALVKFRDYIMALDEPTIVLFIGDHYPGFSIEAGVYEDSGITAENCYKLYVQPYLMFDNFGADYSAFPEADEYISSFYLPHLLNAAADAPANEFKEAILSRLEEMPIYTDMGLFLPQDEILDMLSYDRTKGEKYSAWDSREIRRGN